MTTNVKIDSLSQKQFIQLMSPVHAETNCKGKLTGHKVNVLKYALGYILLIFHRAIHALFHAPHFWETNKKLIAHLKSEIESPGTEGDKEKIKVLKRFCREMILRLPVEDENLKAVTEKLAHFKHNKMAEASKVAEKLKQEEEKLNKDQFEKKNEGSQPFSEENEKKNPDVQKGNEKLEAIEIEQKKAYVQIVFDVVEAVQKKKAVEDQHLELPLDECHENKKNSVDPDKENASTQLNDSKEDTDTPKEENEAGAQEQSSQEAPKINLVVEPIQNELIIKEVKPEPHPKNWAI